MNSTIAFYNKNADTLSEQYRSTSFQEVHRAWKPYWPKAGQRVLDIGAGEGRDSRAMAELGCEVYAVEPSEGLRTFGINSDANKVTWLDDKLPELDKVKNLGMRFDLILVSAIWMHLNQNDRKRSFRKLANLLAPGGKLVITLRYGGFSDGRTSHQISAEELEKWAGEYALQARLKTDSLPDSLGRNEVEWQTLVFNLPDDGTGDLVNVRHIIVNDSKSSTYKLALLRSLLRIADAHPGAVLDRSDGKVVIPFGLVGIYWIRQFRRLIDKEDIQQNSNTGRGLGFIKKDGWDRIQSIAIDDISIGSLFLGDEAKALHKTLADTLKTIRDNPVKYTYQGDISNPYFEADYHSFRVKESLFLDSETLSKYGTFTLDESLWECFRLYHSWIEPLVVNQWIREMQRFARNQERKLSLQTYHDCLVWIDSKHDTRHVRKRVEELQATKTKVCSVWSGKNLAKEYQIDHCLPFAYWPNNDTWNLLPATSTENRAKSDRVPNTERLNQSKSRILEWWQTAWGEETHLENRFFTEAALSLPNVPSACRNFEEVFEAMGLQVRGVKSRLLIGEW